MAMAIPGAFALAASHGRTHYVGKTRQHRTIRLEASADQVQMKGFSIELHCRDGSLLVDEESNFESTAVHNGGFRATLYGSTDIVSYSGRVRGSRATGTVKVRDRLGKVRCVSPTVKFTAHRR
jgi:hypothetical protein